jgi:hypothetical protein
MGLGSGSTSADSASDWDPPPPPGGGGGGGGGLRDLRRYSDSGGGMCVCEIGLSDSEGTGPLLQGWSKNVFAPMPRLSEARRVPPQETVTRGHGGDCCACRCNTSKYNINSYNTGSYR